MRGVGTKMGTVQSRDSGGQGQTNIRTSGQHGTYKTYKTRTRWAAKLGFGRLIGPAWRDSFAQKAPPVAPRSPTSLRRHPPQRVLPPVPKGAPTKADRPPMLRPRWGAMIGGLRQAD